MKLRVKSLAKTLHQPFSFDKLYEVKSEGTKFFVEADGYPYKFIGNRAYLGSLIIAEFEKVTNADKTPLEILKNGPTMNTAEFLNWVADRFVYVYGENPSTDFVLSCRERADEISKVIEILEGK